MNQQLKQTTDVDLQRLMDAIRDIHRVAAGEPVEKWYGNPEIKTQVSPADVKETLLSISR